MWYHRRWWLTRAGVAAAVVLMFLPSVRIREETFGRVCLAPPAPDSAQRVLTALATTMAAAWARSGPWNIGFELRTTEPTPENRVPAKYQSYPPGFLVPPYLLHLLGGAGPSVASLMGISLAWHLALAWILALLALGRLEAQGFPAAAAAGVALVTSALVIYLPAPLLFFQNVWWPELAGLVPFAAVILLEQRRRFPKAQLLVLLCAMLTDWLAFLLVPVLLAKRALDGERRELGGLAAVAALGLGGYLAGFVRAGGLWPMMEKAWQRTGLAGEAGRSWLANVQLFWESHMLAHFGWPGLALLALLAAGLACAILRRRIGEAGWLLAAALAPVLLHSLLLSGHHANHSYQALKFTIPLALFPALLAETLRPRLASAFLAAALAGLLGLAYAAVSAPLFRALWAQNASVPVQTQQLAEFVGAQALETTLLFSPSLTIEPNSTEGGEAWRHSFALAFSRKPVHHASGIEHIKAFYTAPERDLGSRNWWPRGTTVAVAGEASDAAQLRYWERFAGGPKVVSGDGRFYLLPLAEDSYLPKR